MNAWLEIGCSNALMATALALGVWAFTRVVRRAELALVLWLLVLAKLLMPPLVSIPWESLSVDVLAVTTDSPVAQVGFGESASKEIDNVDAAPVVTELDPIPVIVLERREQLPRFEFVPIDDAVTWPWVPIFGGTWLAGSAIWFTLAAVRMVRFSRALRHAEAAGPELQREVRILANRLMLGRVPSVRMVGRPVPPLVWAMFGQATVLLPTELMDRLSSDERTTLLAHELTHLKRRDHSLRWLSMAALGLYWWHPVAWWTRRNVERAQEHCCDARVVELFPALARAYAEAMLATVDFLSAARPALPLGASGFSQARLLKRRMEMVLEGRVSRRVSWPLRVALLSFGLLVLPVSISALWGDPAPVENPEPAPQLATEPKGTVAPVSIDRVTEERLGIDATEPKGRVTPVSERYTPKFASPSGVEQRLERLEKMLEVLTHELQTNRKVTQTSPQMVPGTMRPLPVRRQAAPIAFPAPVLEEEVFGKEASESVNITDEDLDREVAEIVRQAALNLELSKTNYNRAAVADRQLEAVREAYESETVTLDQLLETVRRKAEAHIAYHRSVHDIQPHSPERNFLFARANLSISNKALKESKDIWKKVHQLYTTGSKGGEAHQEAQAREQYFQFKSQTETLLNEYYRAEAAMKAAESQKKS